MLESTLSIIEVVELQLYWVRIFFDNLLKDSTSDVFQGIFESMIYMNNINKVYVANTLKQSAQYYQQSKYICEGYKQQQQILSTRCFMGFTQSSDDFT